MEEAKIFGMKMSSAVTILCILVVLLIILIIFIIHKMNVMARKYEMLMSGKKGADLEKIIRIRFKEMDQETSVLVYQQICPRQVRCI